MPARTSAPSSARAARTSRRGRSPPRRTRVQPRPPSASRLSGPRALRPEEQVAILADATGRPIRFEPQSDEEARAEMEAAMPKAYVDAFFEFFAEGTVDETTVHPTVADVTGREPLGFEQWAAAHADDFR